MSERGVIVETERSDVAEHVVRALWRVRGEARGIEDADEVIATCAVLRREPVVVRAAKLERNGDRLLQRRRRADGDEVVHLSNGAGQLGRRDDPSDPPAGDGERLA